MGNHEKQERFCREYLLDADAAQAYIRAGYSEKGAEGRAGRLLEKAEIQARIAELTFRGNDPRVAQAEEILQYLTTILRGDSGEDASGEPAMAGGCGKNLLNIRERMKAAEMLGKRYGLFSEQVTAEIEPVTLVNNIPRPEGTAE